MSNTDITPKKHPTLPTANTIGQAANRVAARHAFSDYFSRLAPNTRRRHSADLFLFADFLASVGIQTDELMEAPDEWAGVTWGLVKAFVEWMLQEGYAVGSVNVRLSTVRTYARLAVNAGALTQSEYDLIAKIRSFNRKEARNIDNDRDVTRRGSKKAEAVPIGRDQATRLKQQPPTPQGRRDALLMCLLLDHGLRVGEVALLRVEHFDLQEGTFTFDRPKVNKVQKHSLTVDTQDAARAYITQDVSGSKGCLLVGSRRGGRLTRTGMSARGMTQRVNFLGKEIGLFGLSAHDCRHYWSTAAVRGKTPLNALMQAGGWNSPAMPMRYIQEAEIANEGVQLDSGDTDITMPPSTAQFRSGSEQVP